MIKFISMEPGEEGLIDGKLRDDFGGSLELDENGIDPRSAGVS